MQGNYTTSQAALHDLGKRLKGYRIDYPMTQKQLADRSGVSLRCIQRLENGEDIQASNLFKLLHALGLSDHISLLIPDVSARPSAFLAPQKKRQRARLQNSAANDMHKPFQWGDEK